MSLFDVLCQDKLGEGFYAVHLLKEFGKPTERFTPEKIADLWSKASQYDVLFSDYTEGKFLPFMATLMDPRGVWFEITREEEPVGTAYITNIVPQLDAEGHFTFWDSVAAGRESIIWLIAKWIFDQYNLHRITATIPVYQAGVIRFVEEGVGFVREGEKREGILHKGKWMPLAQFGMLREELEEKLVGMEVQNG